DSADPVRREVAAGRATVAAAAEGVAVLVPRMTAALYRKLHDEGACRSCHYHNPEADEQAAAGLFVYEFVEDAETGAWYPPYTLSARPERPLHVDELPPGVRDRLKKARFAVRFAEAPRVQPAEHGPCAAWGGFAYLDAAGKAVRPLPGHEQEYA